MHIYHILKPGFHLFFKAGETNQFNAFKMSLYHLKFVFGWVNILPMAKKKTLDAKLARSKKYVLQNGTLLNRLGNSPLRNNLGFLGLSP